MTIEGSDARSWLVMSNYVIAAQGAVSGPLVARTLGPDGRGQSAAVLTAAVLAATVAGLGLTTALNGRAAAFNVQTLVAAAKRFRPLVWVLSLSILPAIYFVGREVSIDRLGLLLLVAFPVVAGNYASAVRVGILIAIGRYRRVFMARVVASTILLGALSTAAILGADVVTVTGIYLVGSVLPALVPLPKGSTKPMASEVSDARSVLRADIPAVTAQSVLSQSNARADQVILPLALSNSGLGFYSVAVTYSALSAPLNSAVALLIMRRMGRNGLTTAAFPWRAAGGLIAASLLLAANAFWVIPLLFGSDFEAAVIPAVILCLGSIVTGLSIIMTGMLIAAGRTNKIIVGEVLTVLLIPLTLPISAQFGPSGAAVAASVSYLANFVYLIVVVNRSGTLQRRP